MAEVRRAEDAAAKAAADELRSPFDFDDATEVAGSTDAQTELADASARRAALNAALSSGEHKLIVADAAATRGLHLDGVSTVIVLGLAANADTYLHLAGRTGRWSADGRSNTPGSSVAVTVGTQRELQTLRGWSNGLGGLKFSSMDAPLAARALAEGEANQVAEEKVKDALPLSVAKAEEATQE